MILRRFRICTVVFLVLILTSSIFTLSSNGQTESEELTDLEGINVAVYGGEGVLEHDTIALIHLFAWMNASVDRINASNILDGELEDYEIIAYPGGVYYQYHTDLGKEGLNIIREFVSNGGSYVGVCGGASLALEYSLKFYNGTGGFPPYQGTGPYLINMTVNRECEGPDLSDLPETFTTMYWGSAYFTPLEDYETYKIAFYGLNGEAGMITFRYGHGTVFMCSPHAEYEEGDDRDGTDFYDELNDPDSEWELMRRVMVWLIEESDYTPEPSTTTTSTSTNSETTTFGTTESGLPTMVLLGTIGMVAIVIVVVASLYYQKKS